MDPLTRQEKLQFVRQQMARYSGVKKETGPRMMILCPFHSENTPSAFVTVGDGKYSPGSFYCFACEKGHTWDKVAPLLGLEPFTRQAPSVRMAQDLQIDKGMNLLMSSDKFVRDEFKFSPLPAGKKWRGISTDLLIKLGGRLARKWLEDYHCYGKKFIHFPVQIGDQQVGYFLARLKKEEDKPSYLLAKSAASTWSKTHGLWPLNYSIQLMEELGSTSIVLVEGQRDALRLLSDRIPAVCIFGTQSWSVDKIKILEARGVDRCITFMDGDCAGLAATDRITESFERSQLMQYRALRLWEMKGSPWLKFKDQPSPSKAAKAAGVALWDPGNCPQRIIDRLKSKFF